MLSWGGQPGSCSLCGGQNNQMRCLRDMLLVWPVRPTIEEASRALSTTIFQVRMYISSGL